MFYKIRSVSQMKGEPLLIMTNRWQSTAHSSFVIARKVHEDKESE